MRNAGSFIRSSRTCPGRRSITAATCGERLMSRSNADNQFSICSVMMNALRLANLACEPLRADFVAKYAFQLKSAYFVRVSFIRSISCSTKLARFPRAPAPDCDPRPPADSAPDRFEPAPNNCVVPVHDRLAAAALCGLFLARRAPGSDRGAYPAKLSGQASAL